MQKVQTNEHLLGDATAKMQWHALEVVPFDDLVQVDSENFEHETEVVAVRSLVNKTVQQANDMSVVLVELLIGVVFL